MGEENLRSLKGFAPCRPRTSVILPRPPKPLYNWISLTGAVFAVGSIFAFLLLFAIEALLPHSNPYVGLLVYIIAPICFFVGMFLILVRRLGAAVVN